MISMPKEKSIKVNVILNVIKTLSSILFPLVTFPYASRVLQPENIGKVNFGNSIVSYFALIATLGITTYAIRECSSVREDKELLSKRASEIFSINICTTVIAYIALFITLIFLKKLDSYRTLIIVQSTVILFATLGADWLNSAMEDFTYITIRTIAFQVMSLCLMFLFVKQPSDYMIYAGITVFSSSGANLLNMFYRKKYCNVRFTINMRWDEHIKPIVLLFVMILAQTIFNSADITMLGFMKDDYEVGIYSTALKIENIIAQVSSSLAWVFMPRLSSYFAQGDFGKINKMLKDVFGMLLFIGLPSIAGVIALSQDIVKLVGGIEYSGSALPLSILMISFLFSLLGGSFLGNMVLLPSKNEKIYMFICVIATIINVILNLFLIPLYGAVAAAGTTAVCSLLMMIMMLFSKDKRIRLENLKNVVIAPIFGSILIFAICKLLSMVITHFGLRIVVCISVSVITYIAIMIVTKNDTFMSFYMAIRNKIRGNFNER